MFRVNYVRRYVVVIISRTRRRLFASSDKIAALELTKLVSVHTSVENQYVFSFVQIIITIFEHEEHMVCIEEVRIFGR